MKNNIVEIHYYVDKINGRNNTNTFNEFKKPPKINQSVIRKHILPFQRNFSSVNLQINCNGNKQILDGTKSVKSSKKKKINLPKIGGLFLTGNNVRAKSATKKTKENKNNDVIIKLNPKRKDLLKNVEKIHDMNRFCSNYHITKNNGDPNGDENKPFILEKINLDILKHVQIPFTLKDEKFRMTKFFKDFGQITKISFSPSKKV